jgi:subtilisin family serine protease
MWAQPARPNDVYQAAISDHLQDELAQTNGPVSFLVILNEQINAQALLQNQGSNAAARQTKGRLIYEQLTALAQRSQAPLRAWLDARGIRYRTFYLVNMLAVEGDTATVTALRQRPEVNRLVANPMVRQQLAVDGAMHPWRTLYLAQDVQQTAARPYGLDFTHAPNVWAMGYTGQGIVVASQDTGVKWDHPALVLKYRGTISHTQPITSSSALSFTHPYNWYDYWGQAGRPSYCASDPQIPCDDHGHGTHTVGTMLGDATLDGNTVLGMAPGAQWIGCRNMERGVGRPESYIGCFEFFLAPYPQGGNPQMDGKPELAPHIINNSWGCPSSEGCDVNSLRQVVETVRAAGIMVVASAGNSGSNCRSVNTPIALYDAVFSVGAHNRSGNVAGFSSRGPVSVDGSQRLKPDMVAPGVEVYSTWVDTQDGENTYNEIQGTSMASPHVAGAVALLWSAAPTLTGQIDLTEQVLVKSATPAPYHQCNEADSDVSPNNTYGYGRLDVLAAVQMARNPASVRVRTLDPDGAPLASVPVVLIDTLTHYRYTATTDQDGAVQWNPVYAGRFRVETESSLRFASLTVELHGGENSQLELREQNGYFLPLVFSQ